MLHRRALDNFRKSNGWEAGVDGTITVIDWGAAKDIASLSFEKPIYAFVFNAQGIMGGISIEGTKFTKMQPGKTEVYDDIQKYTKVIFNIITDHCRDEGIPTYNFSLNLSLYEHF